MFALFNQYEQPVTITIRLLKQLNVKVTDTTVNETILNHPDYPGILSISDALSTWHVENAAIKIKPDMLAQLPIPFIAFIKSNGNSFILITDIRNDKVFYLDTNNKTKKLTEFQQQFSGVVLLAEADENSGEADFKKAKQKQRIQQLKIPVFVTVGLFLIAVDIINSPINNSFATAFSFLLILKFAGALITVLLLCYDVDKVNPALQKICNGAGKTNCAAILNSRAAKIFGLSWSEIGFFYFAGGFLILLISLNTQVDPSSTFQLIQLFNLLTLPYVFFSIYYQWRLAKQWCPLCLTVQAILALEFIAAISFGILKFALPFQLINSSTLSTFPIAFTLPIITWFIIKPLLYNKQKVKQDFRSLQKIKFNNDVFNLLLEKQKRLTAPTDGLGICLGNSNTANTIIKVCNPYCGPCAKAHPEVEKLLEENKNLKAQIIFTATNNENDSRALPVKHLLAIAEQGNETLTKNALNDWYLAEKKDYKVFAEMYPMNGELKIQKGKLDAMKKWCDKVEISFTPTFFYNGYQLPDAYSIGDLKYFLAE